MRPGYARLGLGIDKADSDARTRIDEIKAKLTGGETNASDVSWQTILLLGASLSHSWGG
jgi:hypothetical protein